MDCKHKRSSKRPVQMRYPVVDVNHGNVDMMNGWIRGEHSQKCRLNNGFPADGCPKDSNDNKKPAATKKKSYTNIKVEMHAKTEEFTTNNLAQLSEKIWAQVKMGWWKLQWNVVRPTRASGFGACVKVLQKARTG